MTEQVSTDQEQADDAVVRPPVAVDPAFSEAVEDALAGPQVPTSPVDPNRTLGADPHDFAGLYIRHRSSFALHARRFLRDPRDVDEVVQEAFLRLFLALPELDSELQALAYCRRTITNLCIDRYRADMRRPRLVDLESVPVDVLGDDEPDDPVIQAEDAAIVREALALLSPLHREALVKREIEEKALPVIAQELGVPEDSVKHLLHRARRALRRRLAETHLAPGVDPDDVSTLSLLARSAVSGTGRVGVFVLLALGLVLGATTKAPVQAIETISALWEPDPAPATAEAEPVEDAPVVQPPLGEPVDALALDDPGPIVAPPDPIVPPAPTAPEPAVQPVPDPVPASATVTTSPSPAGTPSATSSPSQEPTAEPQPSSLPTLPVDPQPEPTATPASSAPSESTSPATASPDRTEPTATATPSASASAEPRATITTRSGQPAPAEGGPVIMPRSSAGQQG